MKTIAQIINNLIPGAKENLTSAPPLTPEEYEQLRVNTINETPGNLKGYDCPICKNRGYVAEIRYDTVYCATCECFEIRGDLLRAEKSGLSDALENYTLEKYQTPQQWQREAKQTAIDFISSPHGWFCATGCVGSGKSHLCTAVAGTLLKSGLGVRYMLWRDAATRIKASVTRAEEYEALTRPLKTIKCLYIDDFFKGGINPADINLAFEIINARYNDKGLITIISSEKDLDELCGIDEAIGSRIYERSKGFYLKFTGNDKNWRLK